MHSINNKKLDQHNKKINIDFHGFVPKPALILAFILYRHLVVMRRRVMGMIMVMMEGMDTHTIRLQYGDVVCW